jgi:protein-S-isoprenylcysteine O-methyltransferase Ste14
MLALALLFVHITLERLTISPRVDAWREDRRSKGFLALAFFASVLLAFAERGRGPFLQLDEQLQMLMAIVGVACVVLGAALRQWSIHTLGEAFTDRARVVAGQQLVKRGPYAWVRHPGYSGLILVFLGFPMLVASVAGLVLCITLCTPALAYRISVEEQLLERHFEAEWIEFASSRPRLLPSLRQLLRRRR